MDEGILGYGFNITAVCYKLSKKFSLLFDIVTTLPNNSKYEGNKGKESL